MAATFGQFSANFRFSAALLERLPARGVLAMGGDPVVVLSVGGASFLFGPGVSGIVVQVPMDAAPDLAVVDEVSLDWGPVREPLSFMAALDCGGL